VCGGARRLRVARRGRRPESSRRRRRRRRCRRRRRTNSRRIRSVNGVVSCRRPRSPSRRQSICRCCRHCSSFTAGRAKAAVARGQEKSSNAGNTRTVRYVSCCCCCCCYDVIACYFITDGGVCACVRYACSARVCVCAMTDVKKKLGKLIRKLFLFLWK